MQIYKNRMESNPNIQRGLVKVAVSFVLRYNVVAYQEGIQMIERHLAFLNLATYEWSYEVQLYHRIHKVLFIKILIAPKKVEDISYFNLLMAIGRTNFVTDSDTKPYRIIRLRVPYVIGNRRFMMK